MKLIEVLQGDSAVAVRVRHNQNGRLGSSRRDQALQDGVDPDDTDPVLRLAGKAVQKLDDREPVVGVSRLEVFGRQV